MRFAQQSWIAIGLSLCALALFSSQGCTLAVDLDGLQGAGAMGGGEGGGQEGGAGGAAQTGGMGGDGGDPTTMPCSSLDECPIPSNSCEARACIGGECATVPQPPGVPAAAADQVAGDCIELLCDGQGSTIPQADEEDLPVDGTDCTEDQCIGSMAFNPPLDLASTCATGGGALCDGSGACVQCITPSDCTHLPPDDECATRTCINNVCGQSYEMSGFAVTIQTTGDCKERQCDGAGVIMVVNDDSDLPVDGNECTEDLCNAGTPSNPDEPDTATCGPGGTQLCNGSGACGCTAPTDCGTDTFCQTFACVLSFCQITNTTAGVALPGGSQTANDCQELQCDGNGAIQSVADNADLPVDDGNECTDEVCTGGVGSHPDEPIDTVCTSGGIVCDGNGSCVDCNSASQCPQGQPCETASCTLNACLLTDTPMGTTAPSSEQTPLDCTLVVCDGSGNTQDDPDPTDLPDDSNECTDDVCTGTTPSNPPLIAGTSCQMGAAVCDGAGLCTLPGPLGSACTSGAQCASNNCVDGVCCNAFCGGLCNSCLGNETGGSSGTCGSITAGTDPGAECAGTTTCAGGSSCAQCATVWDGVYGDANTQIGHGVAVDSDNNVIVVGSMIGNVSFGGPTVMGAGQEDIFIAKYDPGGVHVWSFAFGDSDRQVAYAVAVDAADNIYVAGAFAGRLDFRTGPVLQATQGTDAFVAQFNPSGGLVWARAFGGEGLQFANAIDVSASAVALTGNYTGNIDFGCGSPLVAGNGSSDIFVAVVDKNTGACVFDRSFGDDQEQNGHGIVFNAAGTRVTFVGGAAGTVNFGGGQLATAGGGDVAIAQLDAETGAHIWSRVAGDASKQAAYAIAVDEDDDLLITGELVGSMELGGMTMSSPSGDRDLFIAKLNLDSTHVWSRNYGDANDQGGHGITTDAGNNVMVTGDFQGELNFGDGDITADGTATNIFFARFTPTGANLCSRGYGDDAAQGGLAIATTTTGVASLTGAMAGTADFGLGTRSASGTDVFVVTVEP